MIQHLTAQDAREYFTDPACGLIGDDPAEWMDFRALGGVCGAFHRHLWPGVWMGHLGALRGALGQTTEPAKMILQSYAAEVGAARIIGWVEQKNRPMLALARRIGFTVDGVMPLASPVAMLGWEP
jgi:hypothetical protein